MDLGELLLRYGFPEAQIAGVLNNKKLLPEAQEMIKLTGVDGLSKPAGALLYNLLTRFPPEAAAHKYLVPSYIGKGLIHSQPQLDAALTALKRAGKGEINVGEFEAQCGVGVVVTPEMTKAAVDKAIEANKEKVLTMRYRTLGLLLGEVKKLEPWVDGKVLKDTLDAALAALLGPETEEDKKPLDKKVIKEKAAGGAAAAEDEKKPAAKEKKTAEDIAAETQAIVAHLPAPHENTSNDPALLAAHLKRTGGKYITRFPPEPNGYLHIGHAKAMSLSFTLAKTFGGECILRFDDTNPEGESQEFADSILENVQWLGWTPSRITYASELMQQLYDIAVDLVKRGLAYACHQTGDEMSRDRELKQEGPWRNRPVSESLSVFEGMRKGKYPEGGASLRLKMDMKNDNPVFRDPVAWRIKYVPHPHIGDKWCIYPTYDYTHCINDSLEDITHSLCSLEFAVRRDSYMWLLDAAKMYKPVVWEFARLNLSHTVMSKRKLKQLVEQGHVRGWDDPRMPTIMGFRRKGYSSSSINSFVKEIGVSRNNNILDYNVIEHFARLEMNEKCERAFCVIDPVKVVLINWEEREREREIVVSEKRKMPINKVVYIEKSDFRKVDSKDYYGLAPNKEVFLRYAGIIRCEKYLEDAQGNVTEIHCTYIGESTSKPKGVLHWVSERESGKPPLSCEIRLYNRLLTVYDSADLDGAGNWLDYVNPEAEVVYKNSYLEPSLANVKPGDRFQFERMGFFCCDIRDSTPDHIVFNRTVTLREDKAKGK